MQVVDAIAQVERMILADPESPTGATLARLLAALRNEAHLDLADLYSLSMTEFQLAMEVLAAWRVQRYYRGSAVAAIGAAAH
jgi:hypothetical protein